MTIKAASTATDKGEFSALAAAYTVDRGNDQIIPGAFKATIARWQESGKNIPLHWDHESSAASIIGYVDPATMRETRDGLVVKGKLDLENSDVAREAWRAMKDNSVALSFGYLVEDSDVKDGITELKALDLFEVSLTPAPMNPDTRIVSMKSVKATATLNQVAEDAEGIVYPDGVVTRATWTPRYVADLPDSSFLHVEDERQFPVKDASGAVDMPHLRNALSRIGQSNLPQEVKDRLTATAQRMLDNMKGIEDAPPEEPPKANGKAQDPLRRRGDELAFQLETEGLDLREPRAEEKKAPEPEVPVGNLRQRSADLMLELLVGSENA